MKAGRLRHKIEIQEQRGTTQDAYGQPIPNWLSLWRPYAEIVPMQGNETLVNGQFVGEATHVVRVRYFVGPTRSHRIAWEGRTFEIVGVIDPEGRRRELSIAANERV